ncbi:MAG: hypothetical protein ABIF85_04590 [Nanoarchaeota archaeon]|nr:hypothetical protein [Nanoarchaeota archaeon]MBU4301014.1 hypothetical protein [Nanoarchaeota archaeon]MBU4452465.1 hypothetical protein [Nanoarchaeota archaeon]MCG2723995.1 hypothetical protein [archaeon]
MTDIFNYVVFSEPLDSGLKAVFDDSALGYDECGKKYTLMEKKAFINYIELIISNFNMIGCSLLEFANVPEIIKIIKMEYPPWLPNHQLDYNTEESHQCIYEHVLNPGGSTIDLRNYCARRPDIKLDSDGVPKNQGVDLTRSTSLKSVAVAVNQMASFENDSLYENRVESPASLRELSQNDGLKYYYPGKYNALCEAVMQVDYLKFTLDCAKNFDESKYVFFIDGNRIPTILPTNEFYSKYLLGKSEDTCFS